MCDRPDVPKKIREDLLFEVRYHCANCCTGVALEMAHIRQWSIVKTHDVVNMVILCANCHTRSHTEKWSEANLKRMKAKPCILTRPQLPPVSSVQRALIDVIVASDPNDMTPTERQRLTYMTASYAGIQIVDARIISLTSANSSRVRLELPATAVAKLLADFKEKKPELFAQFACASIGNWLLRIEAVNDPIPGSSQRTDTSEKGLEDIIIRDLTERGYHVGNPQDYHRTYCVDLAHLRPFVLATQPSLDEAFDLGNDSPTRRQFLARLEKEIATRGVIDVLRKGVKHNQHDLTLFYASPSPGNTKAAELHALNRFSVTRQLRYSNDETNNALDLAIFINGLPIATFELKNSLTKQTVADAVEQYKRDRDAKEPLFRFGRCIVHFAVDDCKVEMCTELKGKSSWFLPFNKGYNSGAGNPPNPNGLMTDYLWKEILTPAGLTDILENYAQIVEEKNAKTGKKKLEQIFPRFHQLQVVRQVLADVAQRGVGRRYLIQHSAGSGKSNSIAWLAHQLVDVSKQGEPAKTLFDSVIIITDRRVLDDQIQKTIKGFAQVESIVGHAEHSGDLRRFIAGGKKIIISTVQKFPFILDEIGDEHRGRSFAIIIDEAHSSQGGKTAGKMSEALAATTDADADEPDPEDRINEALQKRMEAKKMLTNASYFAFTATPKNKTLEMFGEAVPGAEGKTAHIPFHSYTMKQAIEERFILDVLKSYTPVDSWYKLVKRIEDDPYFDVKKANKKLRKYVESHDHAIRMKAEIMVDHFHELVIAKGKIGGQARAMVVCSSIERAIQYYFAFKTYLEERKSTYKAIVAFSGEPEYQGQKVTEASLNGFASSKIAENIQEDPYRFLICANKFQTGYDEPLLHTMYVDKVLAGVQAVQTLSRLNRAHPQKYDVFVLDFINDADTITESFSKYYRTTLLSEETDPNKLHDLQGQLATHQVYTPEQIEAFVTLYLDGADRDKLDPILDKCVAVYKERLDEDQQVDFKGKAKSFVRTYDFLSSILPYTNASWEKLSILLNFLVPKLPAPREEDLSKGILESIDMDSYRVEKQTSIAVPLPDKDAEIGPIPVGGGGRKPEPELDRLSNILKTFNDQFGTLFSDSDRIIKRIQEDIAPKVAADAAYVNAKNNTPDAAKIELDAALMRVINPLLRDDTEFYKQFVQNESFKRFVTEMVRGLAAAG